MAYTGKSPSNGGMWSGLTVSGLHGIALYGLATGLALDYGREAVSVAKGHDGPANPPAMGAMTDQTSDVATSLRM